MRTLIVLICSLALALVSNGAQETQPTKEKKKAATTGHAAGQPAKPAGKPVQGGKPAGQPARPTAVGKGKTTQAGQPTGVAKTNQVKQHKDNPTQTAKPAEVHKAKNQAQTRTAGKPAEMGKTKGKIEPMATGHAATAGQPAGAPKPPAGGKQGKAGVAAGKPFKPQHFNVPKQPNTAKAPPVKFQQNRRIEGSQNWQGQQYAAFRNYHSEWHDQGWWHSHYGNHITFLFGAPYFFNAGYWYPAWGYHPNAYYAWDGPIYAYNHLPPDQVITNVQSALQHQGYYQGEVDGLIGPQTRGALAAYQRDHGLTETSAIDQPTLQTLGMA